MPAVQAFLGFLILCLTPALFAEIPDWTLAPYTLKTLPLRYGLLGPYPEWDKRDQEIKKALPLINSHSTVFLGDSITSDFTVTGEVTWKTFPDAHNDGIGSDTVSGMLYRVLDGEITAEHAPKVVVLMCGTNDLYFQPKVSTAEMVQRIKDLVYAIRQSSGFKTKVLVLGILPSRLTLTHQDQAKEINAALASGELETTTGTVSFVDLWDLFTDAHGNQTLGYFSLNAKGNFVHLNALGYAVWGAAITPFLRLP